MSKIIVSLPDGLDNKLIVDSKDFAALCDLFERSKGYTTGWSGNKTYCIEKKFVLTGALDVGNITLLTQDEFTAMVEAEDNAKYEAAPACAEEEEN